MSRSLKKAPFVSNSLLKKINICNLNKSCEIYINITFIPLTFIIVCAKLYNFKKYVFL